MHVRESRPSFRQRLNRRPGDAESVVGAERRRHEHSVEPKGSHGCLDGLAHGPIGGYAADDEYPSISQLAPFSLQNMAQPAPQRFRQAALRCGGQHCRGKTITHSFQSRQRPRETDLRSLDGNRNSGQVVDVGLRRQAFQHGAGRKRQSNGDTQPIDEFPGRKIACISQRCGLRFDRRPEASRQWLRLFHPKYVRLKTAVRSRSIGAGRETLPIDDLLDATVLYKECQARPLSSTPRRLPLGRQAYMNPADCAGHCWQLQLAEGGIAAAVQFLRAIPAGGARDERTLRTDANRAGLRAPAKVAACPLSLRPNE